MARHRLDSWRRRADRHLGAGAGMALAPFARSEQATRASSTPAVGFFVEFMLPECCLESVERERFGVDKANATWCDAGLATCYVLGVSTSAAWCFDPHGETVVWLRRRFSMSLCLDGAAPFGFLAPKGR